MKKEDIFGTETNSFYACTNGIKYTIQLDNRCRLYRYEKKIGVLLGCFTKSINPDILNELLYDDSSCILESIKLTAQVNVYNFEKQQFEKLQEITFGLNVNKRNTAELLLDAEHINNDGKIIVKIYHSISFEYSKIECGFLRRYYNICSKEIFKDKEITLETILEEER